MRRDDDDNILNLKIVKEKTKLESE